MSDTHHYGISSIHHCEFCYEEYLQKLKTQINEAKVRQEELTKQIYQLGEKLTEIKKEL